LINQFFFHIQNKLNYFWGLTISFKKRIIKRSRRRITHGKLAKNDRLTEAGSQRRMQLMSKKV